MNARTQAHGAGPRICVVYATSTGCTRTVAEALACGAIERGARVELVEAEQAGADHLLDADAIVVGTPVHMGGPDWRVKRFIDLVCGPLWKSGRLEGRVGAVFTTGGGYGNGGGGTGLVSLALLCNLAQLGLVMVPLPRSAPGFPDAGTPWGPYVRTNHPDLRPRELTPADLVSARSHGAQVCRVAAMLAPLRASA